MKYDFRNVVRTTSPRYVKVPPNVDVTYISWRLEGGRAPLSVGWRSLASGNGLIDPMQTAGERGRVMLGHSLSAGEHLTVT